MKRRGSSLAMPDSDLEIREMNELRIEHPGSYNGKNLDCVATGWQQVAVRCTFATGAGRLALLM